MDNKTHDFLLEIGCEELPPNALNALALALTKQMGIGLDQHHLTHGGLQTYASPRRLAIIVCDLVHQQPDECIERKGPALERAFDQTGNPTPACLGFANSCGVPVDILTQETTDKGAWLMFRGIKTGRSVTDLLPEIVKEAIKALPIPKPMHWGAHATAFVRPVHWVIMLYGRHVIETDILGIKTGDKTYGHRFHHHKSLTVKQPADYTQLLFKQGFVVADAALRRQQMLDQIQSINGILDHGQVLVNDALLDEVNALVEWPVVHLATFDSVFLDLPKPVLTAVIEQHQKCFPVFDKNHPDTLLPYFVLVSNIQSHDPQAVIQGNERVMQARLSDAAFFFQADKQHSLASYLPALEHIVYQKQLGHLRDRVQRISAIAKYLATPLSASTQLAERAGLLCKCDLRTQMVGEFPSLQGIMGYYYALEQGEEQAVAQAIKTHYQPRFADDPIPDTLLGCIVALAEKVDTLVGIFGVNQIPTGEKDPFALRRQALGLLRIMIENGYDIDLNALLTFALSQFTVPLSNQQVIAQVTDFIQARLQFWYVDQGGRADIFAAVCARQPVTVLDFMQRLHALEAFQVLPEASALASANKRVNNLLKKVGDCFDKTHVDDQLLAEPAEKQLFTAITQKEAVIMPLLQAREYTKALSSLADLKKPVDDFFEQVLVMAEDPDIKQNRLALLSALRRLCQHVADIALLQVKND